MHCLCKAKLVHRSSLKPSLLRPRPAEEPCRAAPNMQRCRPHVVKILDDQTWPCHTLHLQNTPRISSDAVDDDPGPSCEQICTGMQEFSATWQPQTTQLSTYQLTTCNAISSCSGRRCCPPTPIPLQCQAAFQKTTNNKRHDECLSSREALTSRHLTADACHRQCSLSTLSTKAAVPLQEMRITSNWHDFSLCSKCIRFAVAMAAERVPVAPVCMRPAAAAAGGPSCCS